MTLGTALVLLQLAAASPIDAQAQRDARVAQERFELVRRGLLPRAYGGVGGRCDAVVGRYCYWYDSTETKAPAEPPAVTAAREMLVTSLDAAARTLPADEWIAGQRIRYLIEARKFDQAVAAARDCAGARWWCDALDGLALHAAQRYTAADTAYARALANMPAERRCQWTDLRRLTGGALSKEIARADCEGRAEIARALWRLGQPLWSTPGNDLATEHYARQTMVLILERSETGYGSSFGADNRELLLRYGWSEWFTRQETSLYHSAAAAVTGHQREPSFDFLPHVTSGARVPRLTPGAFWLRNPAAMTRYAPRHVEWMGDLRHQLARLPRGDSMLLVVAHRAADARLARDSAAASIAWLDDAGVRILGSARDSQPIRALAPRVAGIASVEVVGRATRRVERARYTVDPLPCSTWCLSDALLFVARESARDVSLDDALDAAVVDTRVSATAPLGVYWEIHGAARTPATVSLTIEPVGVSRLRRVAATLKLASQPSPVRLRWTEMPDEDRSTHSLLLRLPPSARGRMRVVLTVEPRGAAAQTVSREIEVIR